MEKVITNLGKYLKGWLAYFGYCQRPSRLMELEAWIRRRLRCAFWRQWKTGMKGIQLRNRGVGYKLSIQTAGTNKGPWYTSSSPALCIGMPKPSEPPYTDPYVRWCGRGSCKVSSYPDQITHDILDLNKAMLDICPNWTPIE